MINKIKNSLVVFGFSVGLFLAVFASLEGNIEQYSNVKCSTSEEKAVAKKPSLQSLQLTVTNQFSDIQTKENVTIDLEKQSEINALSKGECEHDCCKKARLAVNSYAEHCLKLQREAFFKKHPKRNHKTRRRVFLALQGTGYGALGVGFCLAVAGIVVCKSSQNGSVYGSLLGIGIPLLLLGIPAVAVGYFLNYRPLMVPVRFCFVRLRKLSGHFPAVIYNCPTDDKKTYELSVSCPNIEQPMALNCNFFYDGEGCVPKNKALRC